MASRPDAPMTIHSGVVTEPTSEQSLLLETTKEIERARLEGFTEIEWDAYLT